jgi:voltage-gated potassium channel
MKPRKKSRRRTDPGLAHQIRYPLMGLAAIFAYGVAGYMAFGSSVLESLHRTALVLTTVGFTAETPPSIGEKVFTASIALFGVAVFLASLAVVGAALAEGRFGAVSRRRRMERTIKKLDEHFILCAYGRVGRAVAREFEAEGVPFVVIDKLEDLEDRMRYDGMTYLIADPTSENVLREAGIDRARGLVSAVDSDADNIYITLTARSMKQELFIVARASESAAADRLYRAGANRVISPYVSSGRHMAMLALRPRVVDVLEIAGRPDESLRLEEVMIEKGSPLAGQTIDQVAAGATALVLRRPDGSVTRSPQPGEQVREGDLLVLLGEMNALRRAEGN